MKVIIQEPLSREVFWHEYAKIPRVARKNPLAENIEQLRRIFQTATQNLWYTYRQGHLPAKHVLQRSFL